jgi:ABC-2 type transport system permease protein
MTSKQSFNSGTLFIDAIKRFKWFSILFGALLFLGMPLTLWITLSYSSASQPEYWAANLQKQPLPPLLFNPLMMLLIVGTAIILGISLYNYLYNERACNFFFSLPVRRIRLYLEHLAAGSTLLAIPLIANGLLSYIVFSIFGIKSGAWFPKEVTDSVMYGTTNVTNTISLSHAFIYWLGISLLMLVFFLVFSIFCGMFTGNFIMQAALTLLGMFLPLIIYSIVQANLWKLLYGYSPNWGDEKLTWFSPLVTYFQQTSQPQGNMTAFFICYIGITLAMIVASIILLRCRKAEATGDTLAAEWMRNLFKFGVATCSALTLGIYFGALYESNDWVLYVGYLGGALLGLIIADMVAYKSFRFFEHWRGMVIFILTFFIIIGGIKLDIPGYERNVPEAAEIENVYLDTLSWRSGMGEANALKDPQTIQALTKLHAKIIANKKANIQAQYAFYGEALTPEGDYKPYPLMTFNFEYRLKNGKILRRAYTIDRNDYEAELLPIYTAKEVRMELMKPIFQPYEDKVERLTLTNYRFNRTVVIYRPDELQLALKALQQDALKLSYDAAIGNNIPLLAGIDVNFRQGSVEYYPLGNISYYSEFTHFTKFLEDYGYHRELFIIASDVESIELQRLVDKPVRKTYSSQQEIQEILDWCYLSHGEVYDSKDIYNPASGKIFLKDGTTIEIYVGIDSPIIKSLSQNN